jgi:anaerobic magnesium-protoporphyrin IX monomethyl ester cyclase
MEGRGMKVLLMVPLRCFLVEPPEIPDLGLGYLASALREMGHDVSIRDWNIDQSADAFKDVIKRIQPAIVGIKVFTKDAAAAKKTMSIVRESFPSATIIIGGPHPSASEPGELMEELHECHFAIRGEAEASLPSLLNLIATNHRDTSKGISDEKYREIPGLVWKGINGEVFSNPPSLVGDLDRLPLPAWDLLHPQNYRIRMLGSTKDHGFTAPIITSRGCPGRCSFCSAYSISGKRIRFRSAKRVFQEMKILYDSYNVRKFMFLDNCFTAIRKNLVELCELIISNDIDIEWDCVCYEKLSNLNDKTLALMYKAGCRMIHIGVESGSQATRVIMNKACDLQEIGEKASLFRKHGIKLCSWFMIGFPQETLRDTLQTIRFAFSLRSDVVMFTLLYPLPGTDVYNYLKNKYRFSRISWADFEITRSPYPAGSLAPSSLFLLLKLIRFIIRLDTKTRLLNPCRKLGSVHRQREVD